MKLINELIRRDLVVSKAEGRRLILQGAVQVDGKVEKGIDAELADEPHLIRIGNRGVFGDIQFDKIVR
jgi:16S rRNA U516 pseudouridylate synthase RsuA-like enzyme